MEGSSYPWILTRRACDVPLPWLKAACHISAKEQRVTEWRKQITTLCPFNDQGAIRGIFTMNNRLYCKIKNVSC